MNNGFLVIDADRHVMEPSDLWDRYLEPEFKGRVRITGPFQSRRYVDGRSVSDSDQLPRDRTYDEEAMSAALFTEDPLYRSVFGDSVTRGFDPASNLRDMDREGVDVHLIIPGTFAYAVSALDASLALEIYAAYHRYLEAYCGPAPDKLKATILVSGADPAWSAAEIAKEAYRTGKTVRQVALEKKVLPAERLAHLLDPWRMTEPGLTGGKPGSTGG
jgi:hypothetical protein